MLRFGVCARLAALTVWSSRRRRNGKGFRVYIGGRTVDPSAGCVTSRRLVWPFSGRIGESGVETTIYIATFPVL